MSSLLEIMSQNLVTSIGWTLLHSLWQSFMVVSILVFFLKIIKPISSSTRYLMYVIGLAIVVLWAVHTFLSQFIWSTNTPTVEALKTISEISFTSLEVTPINKIASSLLLYINENYFPALVGAWIVGVLLISIKTISGLWYVHHIKTHHVGLPNKHILEKLNLLKRQLNISKAVQLFESHRISVPVVIGHIKPIILLPVGICSGLSIEEIEAILAHELSHIKRHDYFINIMQSIVEALLFYNPMIWWLSSQIKKERELSCDDVALHIGIDKLTFAKALANIQQLKINITMAMTLGKNKNHLLKRIKRTVEGEMNNKSNSWDKALSVVVVIGALICLSWYSIVPVEKSELAVINHPVPEKAEVLPVVSFDTTIVENTASPKPTSSKTTIVIDSDISMSIDEFVDAASALEEMDITKIIDASIAGVDDIDDIDFDNIAMSLDTLPELSDLHELTELMEQQMEMMQEMEIQLSKLHELDRIDQDISEEQLRKIEESIRMAESEALQLAKLHEKDFEMDKLKMEQLHEKMEAMHKREFEMLEKLENKDMYELQKNMEKMEKVMREKESEMIKLEDKMHAFEKELTQELINDGYLEKGEELDELRFSDNEITVNGKTVRPNDAKRYVELRKKYLGE